MPCTAEEFARHDVLVVSTAHSDFKMAGLYAGAKLVVDTRNLMAPLGLGGPATAARKSTGHSAMKIFVPGRICLFGEHSDWAGGYRRINAEIEKGYTLITGTNQGIHAEVEPHPTSLVLTSTTPDGDVARARTRSRWSLRPSSRKRSGAASGATWPASPTRC